ncbi:MAG: protein kinase [Actinomycetota bacterium]|nr:protein kinase [Actinomycetota bacterium]
MSDAPAPVAVGHDRYRIDGLIGEGARKRVYRAYDKRLDRQVALSLIKTDGLDEAGVARVGREARAMGRLGDHARIVTVYDVAEDDDGTPYIVSRYLPGGDLEALLRRSDGHRLPMVDAVRVADQVAAALEHAHAHDVVHRDVKPGNVWLEADGSASLGDFGLAVALDRSYLTIEPMIVGTAAYLAPEQAMGGALDTRSDLYGLGAVLYELVTGRPPFVGDDAVTLISQHLHTPPVAPSWHNPDVPGQLEALILRLLAKSPDDRLPDATAVRAALAVTAATLMGGAEPGGGDAVAVGANPLNRLAAGVFVGREAEVVAIRRTCDDALGGRGRLVLVAGEPGIGKTRTAEEITTYAGIRGAQVLWGRCYEGDGAPAYWPWVQVLRAFVHDRDPEDLRVELGTGGAVIAQVVPEIRDRLPDLGPAPALSPEQARFALFDAVHSFMKNAAQRQPLVLVLDDLHWADEPSLLLLRYLVSELAVGRILIIGTYRDVAVGRHHPLAATLADLHRHGVTQRVVLRGLSVDDVDRYIEIALGRSPLTSLVEAVHRETEGNPFFLSEVVRLLAAEGRLDEPNRARWGMTIPQSVREVIGRRLELLTTRCNKVLALAAVVGREFSLEVLGRVDEQPLDEVLDALDEAIGAQLVEETDRPSQYRFSHALIRETLYEELALSRRVLVHRRIGVALEALYADREPPLAELAHHFSKAVSGGDVDKAVGYADRAASRADGALAYEEAARLFALALQDLELAATPEPGRRSELLMAMGRAHKRASQVDQARGAFRDAAAIARAAGDAELLGRAALGFARPGINAGFVDDELRTMLVEAIEAIGDAMTGLRSRLLSRLSMELYFAKDRSVLAALADEAVAVARAAADDNALAAALVVQAKCGALYRPTAGSTVAVVELSCVRAEEATELARRAGDRELECEGLLHLAFQLIELERLDRATVTIERFAALAEELRQPFFLWHRHWFLVLRALLEGRFDEGRRLCDEALAIGSTVAPVDARLGYVVQLLAARRDPRDLDRVAREITEARRVAPQLRCLWAAAALIATERGQAIDARAQLAALAADGFASVPDDAFRSMTLALAGEAAVALGDVGVAATLYEILLPEASLSLQFGAGAAYLGTTSRCLGLLAGALGRGDAADAHFEDACRRHTRMEAEPWSARTQVEQAELLVLRGRPGDADRALRLANDAIELGEAMMMTMLVDRALAVKLRAQGAAVAGIGASLHAVATAAVLDPPDLGELVPSSEVASTVTLLFTDIERSTELAQHLGDRRWLAVLRAHNALIRAEVRANDGMEVKAQGDGFMLAFASASQAIATAVGVQRSLVAQPIQAGDHRIRVRIGVHTGEVLRDADDFFGHHVNLAARIADAASAGEILVSALTVDLLASGDGDGVPLGPWRKLTLKGLREEQRVAPVQWDWPRVSDDVDRLAEAEEDQHRAST